MTQAIERIAEALERIADTLGAARGGHIALRALRPPAPDAAFLTERDRKWVREHMGEEGRLTPALMRAMTDMPDGEPAQYRDLYDVYQQGRSVFVRQPWIGHKSARAMRELFYDWGVDGEGWWHR
jgi:hypothetical protein